MNTTKIELWNTLNETVFDSMYDGIYITDKNGFTLYVNKSYSRISGIKKEDVLGKHMDELVEAGYFKESASLRVLKEKKVISIIDTFKNKKQCLITSSPVLDEYGNIDLVVTNLRELTELNKLNEKLAEAEELKERYKDELDIIISKKYIKSEIKAKSKKMLEVVDMVRSLGEIDSTVLVYGETGVGKEVIASEIHRYSLRKDKPFIKVNCASIPENLVESELFGYEKGAFTGALNTGKKGMFEMADKGTILLDEIGDLPINIQPKLLRVLQESEIIPVGSETSKKIDVRIIAATNLNLKEQVAKGLFREDLFYRLNVIPIEIPPLRQRKEDIVFLVLHYLDYYNNKYNKLKSIETTAMELLRTYSWPGNVRELMNFVERLVVTTKSNEIRKETIYNLLDIKDVFLEDKISGYANDKSLQEIIDAVEKGILEKAIMEHKSSRKVAKVLGVSQPTIIRKARRHGIEMSE